MKGPSSIWFWEMVWLPDQLSQTFSDGQNFSRIFRIDDLVLVAFWRKVEEEDQKQNWRETEI